MAESPAAPRAQTHHVPLWLPAVGLLVLGFLVSPYLGAIVAGGLALASRGKGRRRTVTYTALAVLLLLYGVTFTPAAFNLFQHPMYSQDGSTPVPT